MTCYSPLKGYRSKERAKTGGHRITFDIRQSDGGREMEVPCGQCIGCRLEHSRQWAVRCMHEAKMHENNCFITLTYAPEYLPKGGTLVIKHYQDFMKRLRKKFSGTKIRFYHCGEYGSEHGRPHYHAILFGIDFHDKKLFRVTKLGHKCYISKTLSKLWPFGFHEIGQVTFESSAYVARYIMKKVTGDAADEHYKTFSVDEETGVVDKVFQKQKEYSTMSRRPGLGYDFYSKNVSDIFPRDVCSIQRGTGKDRRRIDIKPPSNYLDQFEKTNPFEWEEIKEKRYLNAMENQENSEERLEQRKTVKEAQVKMLVRSIQ